MLDQLRRMAVLATVVQTGSFVAAARQLQSTTSAISQQIRALERDMGVTLLHRSTRRLSLTPAGQRFHEGCAAMLAAARAAQDQLLQLRDAPEGELRISAPVGFARHAGPALAPLLQAHPGLSLHLEVDDGFTDLIDKRIDLAIRFGRLPDSSWVAQRLGEKRLALFAAPAYLARRGMPTTPRDLPRHDLIVAGLPGAADGLPFTRGSVTERVPLRGRVGTSSMITARAFALEGLGIAIQPEPEVRGELAAGTLVPLLADWALPRLPVHLVTPRRDAQPAKVRHAIAALQALAA